MLFTTPKLTEKDRWVIDQIDDLRRQLRYATSNPKRWFGLLRRDAFARAIRGSNTIEGYNVTWDDASAAAEFEEPLDADRETWMAIEGYREAMTYVLQLEGDPHFQHSDALIRALHYMMIKHDLSKRPGQWRPGPIRVVDERKGEIVYEGPDAERVPELIHELVASLNESDGAPVMVRAAMAHLNLTMVHPFSDGNGRMARALQTLVLAQEGIISPVFCSIEEYLGGYQDEYYAVLSEVGAGSWSPIRDALPWLKFCLIAHFRCAHRFLRRTKEVSLMWEEIEDLIKSHKLPERAIAPLIMAAFGRRLRNSNYRKDAEVSEQVASRDLKKLTDCGLLVPEGERRGRIYIRSDGLKELRESARQPRIEIDPYKIPTDREPEIPGLNLG